MYFGVIHAYLHSCLFQLFSTQRRFFRMQRPRPSGRIAHYACDGNALDDAGVNRHGTVIGDGGWLTVYYTYYYIAVEILTQGDPIPTRSFVSIINDRSTDGWTNSPSITAL